MWSVTDQSGRKTTVGDHKDVRLLNQDQLEAVTGGSNTLGVYRPEFRYKQ